MIIYKVLTKDEVLTVENEGETFGSKKDLLDGFIHFSQKEQLRETLEKYYRREQKLILMAVQVDSVQENLKWEKSRAGKLFPHLYSKLGFESAIWFAPIELDEGAYILPSGI